MYFSANKDAQAAPPVYTAQPGQQQVAPQHIQMGVVPPGGAPRRFYLSITYRRGACFFGGGVVFDLAAAPRSRPFVSCTQILLSRFHPGRGGATVLKVGGTIIRVPSPYSWNVRTENVG